MYCNTQQRTHNKYGGVNKRPEMRNGSGLPALCEIFGNQFQLVNISLFVPELFRNICSVSPARTFTNIQYTCEGLDAVADMYIRGNKLSNQVGTSHQTCSVELHSRPLTAMEQILAAQTLIQSPLSTLIRPQLLNDMVPTQRLSLSPPYCTKLISHSSQF